LPSNREAKTEQTEALDSLRAKPDPPPLAEARTGFVAQTLAMHVWSWAGPGPPPAPGPEQTTPQPPQFALSFVVSTHLPEQRVKPALQAVLQPLLVQVGVPLGTLGHVVPHAPQFFVSFWVSTQTLPQRIYGSVHWKPHVPVQTGIAFGGALQAVPHLPQLEVSLARFTHEPPQLVWAPQSAVHTPALHTVPVPHTVPQPPQCVVSDFRSTQAFPQAV
jgi:hypothetical protein